MPNLQNSQTYLDEYMFNVNVTDLISEDEKEDPHYLAANVEYTIRNYAFFRTDIVRLRRIYQGQRSPDEFQYLTDNYGIGNPTNVRHIPLIRPYIQNLIGKELDRDFKYTVTCNGDRHIDEVDEEIKNTILNELTLGINNYMQKLQKGEKPPTSFANYMSQVQDSINSSFISNLEQSAQHIINMYLQDTVKHIKLKFAKLMEDFCVTGEMYYRVSLDRIGNDPVFEVVRPENFFFEKNANDIFAKDRVRRCARREWMSREEVLSKYGHAMTQEQRELIVSPAFISMNGFLMNTGFDINYFDDLYASTYFENRHTVFNQFDQNTRPTLITKIDVWHVEWIANNKIEISDAEAKLIEEAQVFEFEGKKYIYREDRYEGVRIGPSIYILMGKSKNVIRDPANPYKAYLSYNGVRLSDRQGKPFSMVEYTKDLQDLYDIVHYHRENALALSGVKGTSVDIANIPDEFGTQWHEKIEKMIAYKKMGIQIFNSSQRGFNPSTANLGEYNNSLDGGAIQALNYYIQSIEVTAARMIGLQPQVLGEIEQRDAVQNVKVGIQQSLHTIKELTDTYRHFIAYIFTDIVNAASISYKKGKRGSYVLGSKRVTFNLSKANLGHYNIYITASDDEKMKLLALKELGKELVKSGSADLRLVYTLSTSDSLTEISEAINKNANEIAEKNNVANQLQQQVDQMTQQIQQYEAEIKKLSARNNEIEERKMKLEEEKFKAETQMKQQELKISKDKVDSQDKAMEKRNALERLQVLVNPSNRDNEIADKLI